MDIVLIQPKHRINRGIKRNIGLPLGLLAIATPLSIAGYTVKIIDQRVEPNWQNLLISELKSKPICVGITAMSGPQIWWGLKASQIVKQYSNVPVVWGGIHSSLVPEQTLENPYIDILVQGEGEETFFELVKALGNKQPVDNIKGIWYKENGKIKQNESRPFIDLNHQPPLLYSLIDLKKHNDKVGGEKAAPFESSRGCPYNCAFCYNTCFNRRQWRALSAEQTLFRIKMLRHDYGMKIIRLTDDNFFVDLNRVQQILEGIIREKLNIGWIKGDIRLDLLSRLDDEFLRLMVKSGCRSLAIGIESGSQRIADMLRKEIDIAEVIKVNERLARYNLQVRYLFLIGTPGETEFDLAKTATLMSRLMDENQKAALGVSIFVPYPGTELFDLSVQSGLPVPSKLEDWITDSWVNHRLDYPWVTADKRRLLQMLSFCSTFLAKDRSLKIFADTNSLIEGLAKLYYPIARYRIRGLHDKFLMELKVAEMLGYRG